MTLPLHTGDHLGIVHRRSDAAHRWRSLRVCVGGETARREARAREFQGAGLSQQSNTERTGGMAAGLAGLSYCRHPRYDLFIACCIKNTLSPISTRHRPLLRTFPRKFGYDVATHSWPPLVS